MTVVETPVKEPAREAGQDFIRDIVRADLASGRHKAIVTRFPPEPNGYLHIGHAKSICLNFGIADEFGGHCNLRYDDTNPTKESQEYIDAIERDVRWLGFDWGTHLYHASDYFEQLYGWAEDLIRAGKAYVDDQTQDEMRAARGTLTEPGKNSPFRDRGVEENLDLFRRMRAAIRVASTLWPAAPSDLVPPWVKLGIHDIGIDPNASIPRGVSVTTVMQLSHARLRTYLRAMGIDDALFSAILSDAVMRRSSFCSATTSCASAWIAGSSAKPCGGSSTNPSRKSGSFSLRAPTAIRPHYVDGAIEVGCTSPAVACTWPWHGSSSRRTRSLPAPDRPPQSLPSTAKRSALTRVASAGSYVRAAWPAMSTLDAVADGATIELPGSELGRTGLGNVTLTMDGFSAAYAKLKPRCSAATNVLPWPTPAQKSAGDPRNPASQLGQSQSGERCRTRWLHRRIRRYCGTRRSNSRASPLPSKNFSWIFYIRSCPVVRSAGQLTVRVLEQPQHGTLSIEKGQASTDFPEDDGRAACNTRQSDGTLVFYQSSADYRGADSITLYVVSPLGDAATRHYTIDVK